ncbi:hypothetical protein H8G95_06930 [Bacillus pumilus]|uniref:Uncharacterized protein n=1 Tax=Bacillus pumilus (strain SAFR-032) TaxID=315750 RepID=A0A0U2ITL7_BACP2|nr:MULTISPECIES: hypothetical protein [Bacillus]ALS35547.1 hypothetical protein BPUM_04110 [Bacillus pumilus SAFR-032]MBC3642405.1 hypothetical protein [Bacillus pumilus]MBC3647638.1 hypothetical protein [Bacillus pumilus]MBC3649794.1 hypothetical protein [Bacillus pumilus]MBC3653236.1 hypothetical protein [Bacillus pumilus]
MRNHAKVKSRAKARNLAEAKKVSRKNHAAASTDPIIRKAAVSHTAANADRIIRRAVASHIAASTDRIIRRAASRTAVILAKDVERKIIIPVEVEMLTANGIRGTCGSIAATAKHQIIFFETLFKREYDKKGFFLFDREIK